MSRCRSLVGAAAVLLLLAVVSSPAPLRAASPYTITVGTNAPTYAGVAPIIVTGAVSPAPGPNTGVVVTITNPTNMIVDIDEVSADASTGKYSFTSIPGGSVYWVAGTYNVNSTWGGDGAVASAVVTFTYTPAVTTTSTTSTATTTTSTPTTTSTSTTTTSTTTPVTTTSSTTTTTTATTTPTTTSTTTLPPPPPPVTTTTTTTPTATSTSSTVPEFPAGVLSVLMLIALAAVALLARRVRPPSGLAPPRKA